MPVEPSDLDVLLDVIRHRKNVRRFKPDPVPEEYVNAIIEAARLAPSGANSQPWEFVVIRDPERKKRISDIFIEARKKGDEIQPEFPPTSEATFRAKIAEAPLLLAIVADPRFMRAYPAYGHRDHIFWESLGIVMENIHLAATALGLGICWGTINTLNEAPIGEELGVRAPLVVTEVFSLGFPIAEPPAKVRRDPSSMIHFERLDVGKVRTDEEIEKLIGTRRTADIYSGGHTDTAD